MIRLSLERHQQRAIIVEPIGLKSFADINVDQFRHGIGKPTPALKSLPQI